ncbi:MAG: chitobiase/beta-hexosaminidase C-terminal domain-containing protein [Candidatus Diapherotrites archaeon]|nr:chitobiase/beta-hexosaminidase C-terminal domain-containing protein [Candidatus Diapherotrites archaeon]
MFICSGKLWKIFFVMLFLTLIFEPNIFRLVNANCGPAGCGDTGQDGPRGGTNNTQDPNSPPSGRADTGQVTPTPGTTTRDTNTRPSGGANTDKNPPITTININPSLWYKIPVGVELSCVDESGCAATYYCYDKANTCTPEKRGNYFSIRANDCPEFICSFYIRYYSEDSANNKGNVGAVFLRVDGKAPTTSYLGPSSGSIVQGKAEITLSCTDEGSGCKEIRYSVDGSSVRVYSEKIVISAEGTHEIGFYSVDNAGNEELGKFIRFTVSNADQIFAIRNVKVKDITQNSAKIAFETGTNAEVMLYYGTAKGSLGSSVKSSGLLHDILLSKLDSGTTYYYKIVASAFGKTISFDGEFSTIGSLLGIKLQNVWSSYDSALISWSTSIEANCQFSYGIDMALSIAMANSKAGLMHETNLLGLEPNKRYVFEIKCSSGKESAGLSGEFYTLSSAKPSIVKIEVFKVMPDETIEPYTYSVEEGELLKFVATIVGGSGKRYVWDFGDGVAVDGFIEDSEKGFLGVKQIEAYYSFAKEGEFEVKLSLYEPVSNEIIGDKVVSINVRKSLISFVLLEPKGVLNKSDKFQIKISLRDANGNELKGSYANVYFGSQNIGGVLKDGIVTATFVPQKCAVKNAEFISLKLIVPENGRPKHYSRVFLVRFEPCKLKTVSGFGRKTFYIGDSIANGALAFAIEGSKAEYPISYLRAKLVGSSFSKVLDFNLFRNSASVEINHKVSFKDINGLSIHVFGNDVFGNEANDIVPIKVEPRNPDFYIEPFALPEKLYLLREEKIILKIGSAKYLKGTISIKCSNSKSTIDEIMKYDQDNDLHSYVILLPADFSGNVLDCEFYAYANDRNAVDLLTHRFHVVSTLKIDFISPSKQNSGFSFRPEKIVIEVSYADGAKIGWSELKGKITIDGVQRDAVFRRDNGLYVAELERPLDFNAHNIVVSIESPLKGSGELFVKLSWVPGAFEIGSLLLAVLLIAIGFYLVTRVAFKIKDAKAKLVAEKQSIVAFMKKTKAEYFKRHLSEREFKEKYEAAERKLKALEHKIRNKDYLRFWHRRTGTGAN